MIFTSQYLSPVGKILIAEKDGTITGLWFEGQKYYPAFLPQQAILQDTPVLSLARAWLDRYFAGQAPTPDELPLAPQGTDFQQAVWNELCKIPYGKTVTYGQIAKTLGVKSAQAVGGAVGRNPISIIIPCHRMVGAKGALVGYAGGIEKKQALLSLEGAE